MAKMNDKPVTLEKVWGAAEAAAREHNSSIQDLTNTQLRAHLPRGSDGCIAAFLRQVKIQDLDSKAFDLNTFSPSFQATIVSEIRRFVDNAVAAERMEARVTEEMFDEICKDLDLAQETISTLHHDLEESNSQKAAEVRRLELDLAAARERLVATEEVKSNLAEVRDEASQFKVQLAEATNELSAERSRASNLQQRLSESERDREAAAQKAALEEQRAKHAESTVSEQKELVRDLRDELSQAQIDRNELQAKVSELLERMGKAETRAAVAEERSSTKGKKPRSNGGGTTAKSKSASDTESGNGKTHS